MWWWESAVRQSSNSQETRIALWAQQLVSVSLRCPLALSVTLLSLSSPVSVSLLSVGLYYPPFPSLLHLYYHFLQQGNLFVWSTSNFFAGAYSSSFVSLHNILLTSLIFTLFTTRAKLFVNVISVFTYLCLSVSVSLCLSISLCLSLSPSRRPRSWTRILIEKPREFPVTQTEKASTFPRASSFTEFNQARMLPQPHAQHKEKMKEAVLKEAQLQLQQQQQQ